MHRTCIFICLKVEKSCQRASYMPHKIKAIYSTAPTVSSLTLLILSCKKSCLSFSHTAVGAIIIGKTLCCDWLSIWTRPIFSSTWVSARVRECVRVSEWERKWVRGCGVHPSVGEFVYVYMCVHVYVCVCAVNAHPTLFTYIYICILTHIHILIYILPFVDSVRPLSCISVHVQRYTTIPKHIVHHWITTLNYYVVAF